MPVDKSLTITAVPKTSLNVVSMAHSPTALYGSSPDPFNRKKTSQRDPLGSSTTAARTKPVREQVFGSANFGEADGSHGAEL